MHPYTDLKNEYESWVANVKPLPPRMRDIDAAARRLTRPEVLAHFTRIHEKLGIPEVVQATICERESGCDFSRSPAQGDPWNRVSTHVPRGIGPFNSWEESAIYSWTICDKLSTLSVPKWDLAYACWKWEGYNGLGYRAHGKRTPYVVGGTNLQQPGKYTADGHYDPDHMDTQLGALSVAMRMIELVPSLSLGEALAVHDAPSIVTPLPDTIGGSLTGVRWVQSSLNIALHLSPPLVIDGSFGRRTRASVRDFRKSVGLPDNNGLVDDAFCNKMDAVLLAARPGKENVHA